MKKLSLLPLTSDELAQGLASQATESEGVPVSELTLELEGGFERWIASGASPGKFPRGVGKLLKKAAWPQGDFELERKYPEIFRKLEGSAGVEGVAVLALLSHLHLIQDLARNHRFSAARICQVISSLDDRLQMDFKTVEIILRAMDALPSLSIPDVRRVLEADKEGAVEELGDAGQAELVDVLQELGCALHLPDDFSSAVQELFAPEGASPTIPYLQVLMCVCAIAPFYDHPSEIMYEFKPRGKFGDLIMDQFPKDLVSTKSAMLNNLKSVYRLSDDWARAKRGSSGQAFALVTIVSGLSSLSYLPRKILAESIRRVIFRSLENLTPQRIEICEVKSLVELKAILKAVQKGNTATAGILEQRVTDFLACVQLSGGNWRVRGLGDSVNASNTSSKKLGDLDFQDAVDLKCEAFEAHGGNLNEAYFKDHLLTLEQTLKHRLIEWQRIGDLEMWTCHVTFIAHGFSGISNWKGNVEGIACRFTLKTFQEAIAETLGRGIPETQLLEVFNQTVVRSLNRPACAHSVREKATQKFFFNAKVL